MKYRSVVVKQRGAPEVMQVVENELRDPAAREARIRVWASSVGGTDLAFRRGDSPFAPRVPFVPGYEVVGVVDALGSAVTGVAVGDRVAALTGQGGNSEYIYLSPEHLVPVPASLEPAQAVTLILNYVTAYQMLHRTAKVRARDCVLLIGASGGVGTALLQLGKLAGLQMFGTASASKHAVLVEWGATPIDYRSQDFVAVIRQAVPGGLDFVFDGLGGDYARRSLSLLRRGGVLVEYASAPGLRALLRGIAAVLLTNLWPTGKSIKPYGISVQYRRDKRPFREDLTLLFKWLEEGHIAPVIATKLPLLEAATGHALLEGRTVVGNVVLLSPELH